MAAVANEGKPSTGQTVSHPSQAAIPATTPKPRPIGPSLRTVSTSELDLVPMSRRWQGILRGESALAFGERVGRRLFSLVPAQLRCKFCNAPFRGRYAGPFGLIGFTPSRKNPTICERCIERAPEGGALVPVSVLFADVRGYTSLAEELSSVETTALLHRFYMAASSALLAHDAILGQIAGDEVMAIFVPGLAGSAFPRQAVEAAGALLRGVGYGTAAGSWLAVGVGICTGEEYVGNVGGGGFKDFTAIGDITNTAARLQASAAGGEILMCATTYEAVADAYPVAEPRDLQLKGKRSSVPSFRIRIEAAKRPR
jgi:adenylate cyclase